MAAPCAEVISAKCSSLLKIIIPGRENPVVVTTGFGDDSEVSYHLLLEISSPSPSSPWAPPGAEESHRQDELDSLSHQTLGETLLEETTFLLSPEL